MALEVAIAAYTAAQVTAINNRIYALDAPVGVATPYVVFNVVSGGFVHSMGGDSGLTETRVQFSVYDKNYATVKGVIEDLKKTYRNYAKGDGTKMGNAQWVQATLLTNETDMYEDNTNLFHTALDIIFFHMEVD